MRSSKILVLFFMLGILSSCSFFEKKHDDQTIARVFDEYLYRSEIAEAIPEGISKEDSTIIARRYIDVWVRNHLMIEKAEIALSDEQKDFEKKIEDYRTSLLIYSYRQKLLQQKMDTVITQAEIQDYYDNNIYSFKLRDHVVKATFVKVNLSAPNLNNVRNWTFSGKTEDMVELEKYSINYADKFDTFNDSWVYLGTLLEQAPFTISRPESYLRYTKNLETSDSLSRYYVHISDFLPAGETTPIELIREDIKSILLNKRKIEFYNDLEKQVYSEGVNRNHFEIY